MAFDTRTRAEIRDSLLADWSARYTAAGRVLDVSQNSDAYMWAEALAVELELFEQQASLLDAEILPDKATYTLPRWGAVYNVPQKPAVATILQCTATGTALATLALAGKTLVASDGAVYGVSANADGTGASVVLDGSGNGTVYATAQLAGAAGTRPNGTILTWGAAPTGANPTATVVATTRAGADLELNPAWAARIIARLQNRPASGNRADWQAWCLACAGVADAYVYPLYSPTYGPGVPGCVTVVVLGPAQGDTTVSRVPSGSVLSAVAGYIEGTTDASGVATSSGAQLRPATMAAGDYAIEAPATLAQNVELQLVQAAAYAFPWTYNAGYAVVAGSTSTLLKLAGDLTGVLKPGGVIQPILVNIGTANYRGGYWQTTPAGVSYNAGSGNTELVLAGMPAGGAPVTGSVVLPPPPNWQQIRLAVFAEFDLLGPGDSVAPSLRWPSQEARGRATLYKSALAATLVQQLDASGNVVAGVQGVLSASVVTPGADVTPVAKQLATLGTLAVHV